MARDGSSRGEAAILCCNAIGDHASSDERSRVTSRRRVDWRGVVGDRFMSAPVAQPIPEDMARDLAADLAACEAAPPGPWRDDGLDNFNTQEFEPQRVIASADNPLIALVDCDAPTWAEAGKDEAAKAIAAFIAQSREGQPAAIRRALAAEAEVVRLKAENAVLLARLAEHERPYVPPVPETPEERASRLTAQRERVMEAMRQDVELLHRIIGRKE